MTKIARNPVLFALMPAVLALAGCGGGGGGSTLPAATPTPVTTSAPPTGTIVALPIHGVTPTVVAYQSGTSGAWKTVTPSGGNVSFTLPVGAKAYSVAAICPLNAFSFAPNRRAAGPAEVVIQATTSDAPALSCQPGGLSSTLVHVNATVFEELSCFSPSDTYQISQISPGFQGGIGVSGNTGGDAIGSPLWLGGTSDIASLVFNAGVPVAGRLDRGVTFTNNGTVTLDPLCSISNAIATSNLTLPSGASSGSVYWAPAEGGSTQVINGTTNPLPVPLIPNSTSGDYYYAYTSALVGGQFAFLASSGSTPSAITFTPPTTPFTYSSATNNGDLASMNCAYNGWTTSGTKYYSIALSWSQTFQPVGNGEPLLVVLATSNYLGSSTTVTMPDLTGVAGMLPNPSGGVQVAVNGQDAIATNMAPWDQLESGNLVAGTIIPNGGAFQFVQSNYFSYNAP